MYRLSERSVDSRIIDHHAHPFLARRRQLEVKVLFLNGQPVGGGKNLPVHLLGDIVPDHLGEFQPISLFHIGSNLQNIADAVKKFV